MVGWLDGWRYKESHKTQQLSFMAKCGERGIRTPGGCYTSTVFKTAAIDHSAISPGAKVQNFRGTAKDFFQNYDRKTMF